MMTMLNTPSLTGSRWLLKLAVATLAGASTFLSTNAQDEEAPAAVVETRDYFFEEAGKEMEYALYVPTTYDKTKKNPLLVVLHGWKSTPQKVIKFDGITEEAEKRGFVVVAPFGYNERGWYGSQGKNKKAPWGAEESDPENLGELSELDVFNVLGIVHKEFSIDEKRIFLMGHAMGGGGTLHLAVTYPEIWAGIAPFSPQYYEEPSTLRKAKDIPTIIVTGAEDEHVKVEGVRKLVAQLKKLDTKHRYIEIEEGDHHFSIAENPEMMADVFDFFEGKYAGEDPLLGEIFRNFTNADGKSIEASLISATEESVTIKRKKDGKRFTLPIASLSSEDQTFINDWQEKTATRVSRADLKAAIDAEPDPELESKLIERLELDLSDPETAMQILTLEIEDKEKEINILDAKIVDALKRGKKNAGRTMEIEALAINEELKTLRAIRADLEDVNR